MLKQTAKKTFLGLRSSTAGRRFYHENVIDHFENPRNVGSFKRDDPDVGTGLVGSPACGDLMTLQIKVDESGHITDSRFKTFGCGAAIAASSVGMLLSLSRLALFDFHFIYMYFFFQLLNGSRAKRYRKLWPLRTRKCPSMPLFQFLELSLASDMIFGLKLWSKMYTWWWLHDFWISQ